MIVGRAEVDGERWRLEPGDPALARLVALGAAAVGGFVAEGNLLLRRLGPRLELEAALSWERAVEVVLALARAQAACEAASLFPGALHPDGVAVREDGSVVLVADELVHGLVGARLEASPPAARWLAPEQAAGQPPDNASNRYALGLIFYRLLTGEHAFAGRGLRLGLEERAERGAPPFRQELAARLPPGLQSTCLALLDPDPARRPASAAAIVQLLREPARPVAVRALPGKPTARLTPVAPRASWPRRTIAVLALAGACVVAGLAASARPVASRPSVVERAPLEAVSGVDDCAGCHPRQAAEWHRSVMAHSGKSPMFQALEMLIEEQVGKEVSCPDGAGILRAGRACVDRRSGLAVTGSGGAGWCVNCHTPTANLTAPLPAWGQPGSQKPLRDLVPASSMEGIGCVFCHQVRGPSARGGNPDWISSETGLTHESRPEGGGIGNSGYLLDPLVLLGQGERVPGGAHLRPDMTYLRSSEFCGSCHDVRLFGTDAGSREPFKRLRNAYSEWKSWAASERRAGREPATCQDCHMSQFPGVCVPGAGPDRLCPAGTVFSPREPGSVPEGHAATSSAPGRVTPHYFSGVDVPLTPGFAFGDDDTLDQAGLPLGARQRRDLLLARTFRLEVRPGRRAGNLLELPVELTNVGAGHRVPAGFSQEREIWIHLRVTDARGQLVYEVGRVDRGDQDLADKRFLRVNTDDRRTDGLGRPLGLFGADVADGPDVPQWSALGGQQFRGRGLVNLQNGFLRCVRCIGEIDEDGRCQPGPGQGFTRGDRFADGDYDLDTGECRSNLVGEAALFETYFPVGALDASRGLLKGPDAIVDTRSAPPGVTRRYLYELPVGRGVAPFMVEATLEFRAFPPFLIRAFAAYEAGQAALGRRPSGPLVTFDMLERLEVVHLAHVETTVP